MYRTEQHQRTGFVERQAHLSLALVSVAACLLFLWPVTANQLTSWDDKGYVTNNPLIRDISWRGLKDIFSTPVMGNYHPLTILTYALEYRLVELEPFLYHFDNLLLHLVATVLSYLFAYQLSGKKSVAFICSLLFGLHPMHVETVAWVADRKDSLSAVFSFAAFICHVRYVRGQNPKWYAIGLLAFVAALLSKPVAVTVPLALLLIDFALYRQWTRRIVWEKLPHLLLAAAFGALAYNIQQSGGAMDVHKVQYSVVARALLGSYALVTYLWKAILPLDLKAIYPYPTAGSGDLLWYCYLLPLLPAGIVFGVWKYGRTNRLLIFGLSFFLVKILLLLQFIPVGDSIVSERYAYLPYFGLFLLAATGVQQLAARDALRNTIPAAVVLLILCYAVAARNRSAVWYNTYTLWVDEISKEPTRVPIAYNNIGFYFFERQPKEPGDNDSAIFYLQAAVELQPDLSNAHEGLGILHYMNRNWPEAEASFWRLTQLRPDAEAYYDMGAVWYELGKVDSARVAYSKSLDRNPKHIGALMNRALIYQKQGKTAEAKKDLDELLGIKPDHAAAYYYRSFCDTQLHRYDVALQDVETAIAKGFRSVDSNYYRELKSR